MKTFEEKWTAWVDDQLTGEELAEFEALLPDKAAAEAEKRDARKLRALLKRERVALIRHHQIRIEIRLREDPGAAFKDAHASAASLRNSVGSVM